MDWSLLGISIALFAIEVSFYFWHEPQIKPLEKRRVDLLRSEITSRMPKIDDLVHFLSKIYEIDRTLIMTVGKPLPHKKIVVCLVLSLVFSSLYAMASTKDGGYWETGLVAITACFWGVALWLGVNEFIYLGKIKNRLEKS